MFLTFNTIADYEASFIEVQQRLVPTLSLVPPVAQTLSSPQGFHSAIGRKNFFGSPLPSPMGTSASYNKVHQNSSNKFAFERSNNSNYMFSKIPQYCSSPLTPYHGRILQEKPHLERAKKKLRISNAKGKNIMSD